MSAQAAWTSLTAIDSTTSTVSASATTEEEVARILETASGLSEEENKSTNECQSVQRHQLPQNTSTGAWVLTTECGASQRPTALPD